MIIEKQILESIFGFSEFRPTQAEVIDHISQGQSCLVVMPTGGGKSLCYQIPALARPGLGVVVSPLIALMEDQVRALQQLDIKAQAWHSHLSSQDQWLLRQRIEQGQLDILYLSPERLQVPGFAAWLAGQPISVLAIDEAHCISQWGHDFRQDYLSLGQVVPAFKQVPVVALTATADARTRADIASNLGIAEDSMFVGGFDRPNLFYRVEPKQEAKQQLYRYLKRDFAQQAGIIYCRSRKATEELASDLQSKGLNALPYHAGLDRDVRSKHQQAFLQQDDLIMVATVAFGMGIDKPDVRFVIHMDLPLSVEAYYQETGRAGRDGLPAQALLFYGAQDLVRGMQMIEQNEVASERKTEDMQRFYRMIQICETAQCRRQLLLQHFEQTSAACGYCDNCQEPPQQFEVTQAAQKALSAVFRTGQRFGMGQLIDVLLGKETDKVQALGHQRLTVFGQGRELSVKQWRSLYRQLLGMGALGVSAEGGLHLLEPARPLLRGQQTFFMRQLQQHQALKQKDSLDSEDQALFAALKALRSQHAKERSIPPYMVFNDATLVEMATRKPSNSVELMAINGVGEKKKLEYGPAFLACIAEFG